MKTHLKRKKIHIVSKQEISYSYILDYKEIS